MTDQANSLMRAVSDTLPPPGLAPVNFPKKPVAQACRHVLPRFAGGYTRSTPPRSVLEDHHLGTRPSHADGDSVRHCGMPTTWP